MGSSQAVGQAFLLASSASAAVVATDDRLDCFRFLEPSSWRPTDLSPQDVVAEAAVASQKAWFHRVRCCGMQQDSSEAVSCFNGLYTREVCCPSEEKPAPPPQEGRALELLRTFFSFAPNEWQILLAHLDGLNRLGKPVPVRELSVPLRPMRHRNGRLPRTINGTFFERQELRLECEFVGDCAQLLFTRLFRRVLDGGLLPMRDPWETLSLDYDGQDYIHGAMLPILISFHRDWNAPGHELTLERLMVVRWSLVARGEILRRFPASTQRLSWRCLDWQERLYGRLFEDFCSSVDEISYRTGAAQRVLEEVGYRHYVVDIHRADTAMQASLFSLIVCFFVFEHLRNPVLAMQQLARLLEPGGFIVWAAPHISPVHSGDGVGDYWRFTPQSAHLLAEEAGLDILRSWAPGQKEMIAGYLLGMQAPFWSDEELFHEDPSWPLVVHLLLQRPQR